MTDKIEKASNRARQNWGQHLKKGFRKGIKEDYFYLLEYCLCGRFLFFCHVVTVSERVSSAVQSLADLWRRSSRDEPPCNLVLKNLCESLTVESASGSEEVCSLHNEKLKLLCLDDKQPVCVVCRDSEKHVNHRFYPISGVSSYYKVSVLLKSMYYFYCVDISLLFVLCSDSVSAQWVAD